MEGLGSKRIPYHQDKNLGGVLEIPQSTGKQRSSMILKQRTLLKCVHMMNKKIYPLYGLFPDLLRFVTKSEVNHRLFSRAISGELIYTSTIGFPLGEKVKIIGNNFNLDPGKVRVLKPNPNKPYSRSYLLDIVTYPITLKRGKLVSLMRQGTRAI